MGRGRRAGVEGVLRQVTIMAAPLLSRGELERDASTMGLGRLCLSPLKRLTDATLS
jgi:hypothetical protein